VFAPAKKGALKERGRIKLGRHPSAIVLNRSGSRLFVASASTSSVAVVDTKNLRVLTTLRDAPPAGPTQGSTPNALALSDDGLQLYVAEADNNAVAVFQLSRASAGIAKASGADRLIGRIPVGWYPSALLLKNNFLFVVNGKGRGTQANPQF
jgi:DNA-binding beta-propeller fold protein YncE